ncbi:26S proteasome subunit RPN7-domain-containing protein [Massariosphaeria phaeospora]|uniref:COP9 signalosome complex subunit 1 n=1 Tax=Massariosphaeria phaeospora TaxID=100035 RepID=A0A7C8MF81_9PLEO|nr:26S proteasome subunit RPN7-domain-containing protein [Massariosphaeria phaeospora]
MAPNVEQSEFFEKKRLGGILIVKDPPKFDLDSYISNYEGFTRLDRLHYIGSSSIYLAVEAYRSAITEAKRGKNVELYQTLVKELATISPSDPAAFPDEAWVEKKTRDVKEELDRLDHELKSYKNNLIKESIRMGNEDMGHFYFACGDYTEAHKSYYRMREHCTSAKHLANMTLRLVYVSIAQKAWMSVQAHLAKVDATQLRLEERTKLDPILSAVCGLAHMCVGNLRDAATQFISTASLYLTTEPAGGIFWQREVLSGNDIAVYGGLCALATMDRSELHHNVLGSSEFRNFLELEPHIRRAITLFCNSKYSACLEILEEYRADYLLDVYLSKVLAIIYGRVRTESIVQYFIPFSCVTLDEMATKFHLTGEYATIEDELESLINNGTLNARIDLVDRLLVSPPTNPRYDVHTDALAMAETYDHTLRLRLTRLSMLAAGMEVRPEKGQHKDMSSGGHDGFAGTMKSLGHKMGF